MSWESTDFPGNLVYGGEFGEQPHAGSFYLPKTGDTLVKIARAAYGVPSNKPGDMLIHRASIINRSPFNIRLGMESKISYRLGFGNDCTALKIPRSDLIYKVVKYKKSGQERPLAAEAGWIALCGGRYQVIWIPPLNRTEPSPIPNGPPLIGPIPMPKVGPVTVLTPKKTMPKSGEQKPSTPVTPYQPMNERKFPVWAAWGIGAALLGTAVYMGTRD